MTASDYKEDVTSTGGLNHLTTNIYDEDGTDNDYSSENRVDRTGPYPRVRIE